ncbi:MAG: SRPBCC family protein, partial [Acidimicrobiales bacterium]
LTRDETGEVHALANVCSHRGAQVVADGTHCQRRLTCPYHGWTYTLDGTHVGLPDAGSFPSVAVPRAGLPAIPVTEEHGLIWVVPDLDREGPTDPELGAIADDFDSFDLAAHQHWRSHRFDLEINWKLVLDTFLEGYHFGSLHRDTVGPLFFSNLGFGERFGRHVREVLPRRTLSELATQPPEQWDLVPHSAIVYALFPNTILVMQIDHIETWRVYPDRADPGRSVCDLDFYVPEMPTTPSARRHWENNWKLTIDTVVNEDFKAMAGVQRGLASGAIDRMTIGANEPALAMVHGILADMMSAGGA